MKIQLKLAYSWQQGTADVARNIRTINEFRPHLVLGESCYAHTDTVTRMEGRLERARQAKDFSELAPFFEAVESIDRSQGHFDATVPVIRFCVEHGIRYKYDESWPDKTNEQERASNNAASMIITDGRAKAIAGSIGDGIRQYKEGFGMKAQGFIDRDSNSVMTLLEAMSRLRSQPEMHTEPVLRVLDISGMFRLLKYDMLQQMAESSGFEISADFPTSRLVLGRTGKAIVNSTLSGNLEGRGLTDMPFKSAVEMMVSEILVGNQTLGNCRTYEAILVAESMVARMTPQDLFDFINFYRSADDIVRSLVRPPNEGAITMLTQMKGFFAEHRLIFPVGTSAIEEHLRLNYPGINTGEFKIAGMHDIAQLVETAI